VEVRVPGFGEDAPSSNLAKRGATISSREFNQDVGKAKRAAEKGPVTITDRGKPAFVLMKYEDYQRLAGPRRSISDLLNHEESKDLDFEPERMGNWLRPFDFD
jgi:prevent-host-death family protein